MKLLHIDSSIQGDGSASREVSAAIVARLTDLDPTLDVTHLDLARDPLPHLTPDRLGGADSAALVDQFLAADIVVIGAPMYNFAIPTQLKAWFDHILVAGKTFSYGEAGPKGLAGDKRVFVAHARGGLYGADTSMAGHEHAESHVRALLHFVGIEDPHVILTEGVAFGAEARAVALQAAGDEIGRIELAVPAL